jgi:hypothetical protein
MTDAAILAADSAFPNEPFACPHCGQMLGPGCRVCVACKNSIDPADIKISQPPVEAVEAPAPAPSPPVIEPARFSWKIFFLVFSVVWLAAIVVLEILGPEKGQAYLGLIPLVSAPWVIFDAYQKRIARPFRWGIGTLILWIVIFPWYLSRRKTPKAPCPFVEGIGLPILLLAYIVALVILIAVFKVPVK